MPACGEGQLAVEHAAGDAKLLDEGGGRYSERSEHNERRESNEYHEHIMSIMRRVLSVLSAHSTSYEHLLEEELESEAALHRVDEDKRSAGDPVELKERVHDEELVSVGAAQVKLPRHAAPQQQW